MASQRPGNVFKDTKFNYLLALSSPIRQFQPGFGPGKAEDCISSCTSHAKRSLISNAIIT